MATCLDRRWHWSCRKDAHAEYREEESTKRPRKCTARKGRTGQANFLSALPLFLIERTQALDSWDIARGRTNPSGYNLLEQGALSFVSWHNKQWPPGFAVLEQFLFFQNRNTRKPLEQRTQQQKATRSKENGSPPGTALWYELSSLTRSPVRLTSVV